MRLKQFGSNQSLLILKNATVLFSYETPVVVRVNGKFLKTDQYFSRTTSRHINQFLNGAKAETVPQPIIESFLQEREGLAHVQP